MNTKAAERMRRMRARRREQETTALILYERADWKLFVDRHTLPQKAGCEPDEIGRVILKELVDNALDSGADKVTLTGDDRRCTVSDNGPGLAHEDLLRVFAVNRALLSSKLKRLPTRGMLGNGLRVVMGAVAAYGGTLTVTTRGNRYELRPDAVTGATTVRSQRPANRSGLTVTVTFLQAMFDEWALYYARLAIDVGAGDFYRGPSQPSWYSPEALRDLLAAAPQETPLSAVVADVFGITGTTPEVTLAWAKSFIARHREQATEAIGQIGPHNALGSYYRKVTGQVEIDGATIPYCVEAWADAEHAEKEANTAYYVRPFLNRSPTLARLIVHADSTGLRLYGCGLDMKLSGPKRADYTLWLSLITPYLRLTGDGKAPYLGHFRDAIESAVKGAANEAYRNLVRPPASMSIVDAASAVMREAYLKASDNNTLPAKARQIMYAARGDILRLTGRKKFDDKYFTQNLLPNYLQVNPEATADWDVVYDARGNLIEPHTGRRIPLGTVPVRDYLGQRAGKPGRPRLHLNGLFPTNGPQHRYGTVLFVEKEGFDELFEAVQLAERYDLAIMSTKGMSVVAARALLDRLAEIVEHILVLHDFDLSGFSICGTLGTDSRRYEFENDLSDIIIDIGLRLDDVTAMGLEAEPVTVDNREARRATLARHGATDDEIEFLAPYGDGDCQRVELNAMTSRQLVDFVEAKLAECGVKKVMPDTEVLQQHARHRLEIKLTDELIAGHAEEIARRAAATELPADLTARVIELLQREPALSWDQALARLV
jgi:hypothetical protein